MGGGGNCLCADNKIPVLWVLDLHRFEWYGYFSTFIIYTYMYLFVYLFIHSFIHFIHCSHISQWYFEPSFHLCPICYSL